ncbi:MAG: prepilin-type N-terminal cleavage/methylation domain-containing protein [Candidatus Zixiibacteriota bacterium]
MTKAPSGRYIRLDQGGFTLIELVIIIVTLGILAAVAIPKFGDMANSSKVNATRQELAALKKAIVGDPSVTAGGTYVDRGFEGDVGYPPSRLQDLAAKPDSVSAYNVFTRLGWNGPYIDSSGGFYLLDAWDNAYGYQPGSRLIFSTGGGSDTISVTF